MRCLFGQFSGDELSGFFGGNGRRVDSDLGIFEGFVGAFGPGGVDFGNLYRDRTPPLRPVKPG
jgi:hypothetical protein